MSQPSPDTTAGQGPGQGAPKARLGRICVYCGSGSGRNPVYGEAAVALGRDLARRQIGLVYGGGGLGLMGQVARATMANGGHVTGIIPNFLLEQERPLTGTQELRVVANMHERKMAMFERSDAFVALPGGIGTLEELVEQLTWSQLGQHSKPVILANIAGFWDPFLSLLAHMREQAFIRDGLGVKFAVVDGAEKIVPTIEMLIGAEDTAATDRVLAEF